MTWSWRNWTWLNSPPIFHSLGHVHRCPILHCYVIKSIFLLKPVLFSFNFVVPTHSQETWKIFCCFWPYIRRGSSEHYPIDRAVIVCSWKKKGVWILGNFLNLGSKNHFLFSCLPFRFFWKKIALTHTLFHRVCGNYFPNPTPKSMWN